MYPLAGKLHGATGHRLQSAAIRRIVLIQMLRLAAEKRHVAPTGHDLQPLREMLMKENPDMRLWQGRVDPAEGPLGQYWHQIVKPLTPATLPGTVALLGFACDAGVIRNQGRSGAREGPAKLRTVLSDMPVHECSVLADAGNVVCPPENPQSDDNNLELAQEQLAAQIAALLTRGLFPLVLGGGNEIGYGSFRGIARDLLRQGKRPNIGIIHFGAHFNLRMSDRASAATPLRQIAEDCATHGWPLRCCCLGVSHFANTEAQFERARELGIQWRLDEDMGIAQIDEIQAQLAHFMAEVEQVYLSLSLDVLPAPVMPGVSTPSAHGVALEVVETLIDLVTDSDKLRLADIAELNPLYDLDHRSACVAARLVARIANNMAA
jgi:formiminoglutamase